MAVGIWGSWLPFIYSQEAERNECWCRTCLLLHIQDTPWNGTGHFFCLIFVFMFSFLFLETRILRNPSYPRTYSTDQAGFKSRDLPASAFQALGWLKLSTPLLLTLKLGFLSWVNVSKTPSQLYPEVCLLDVPSRTRLTRLTLAWTNSFYLLSRLTDVLSIKWPTKKNWSLSLKSQSAEFRQWEASRRNQGKEGD